MKRHLLFLVAMLAAGTAAADSTWDDGTVVGVQPDFHIIPVPGILLPGYVGRGPVAELRGGQMDAVGDLATRLARRDSLSPSWAPNSDSVLPGAYLRSGPLELSSRPPAMEAVAPMEVSVTPERPGPFEEAFVTISGQTWDHYIRLDDVVINYYGNDIEIGLYWSTYAPPLPLVQSAGSTDAGEADPGTLQIQTWGVSSVSGVSLNSGRVEPEDYEVTRSLGGFDIGSYRVVVNSHGVLEGEARTWFHVYGVSFAPSVC